MRSEVCEAHRRAINSLKNHFIESPFLNRSSISSFKVAVLPKKALVEIEAIAVAGEIKDI